MRNRDWIMRELKQGMGGKTNVARNQLVLAEILLDIRDELIRNRGPRYLIAAPKLSEKEIEKLLNGINEQILKEDKP